MTSVVLCYPLSGQIVFGLLILILFLIRVYLLKTNTAVRLLDVEILKMY